MCVVIERERQRERQKQKQRQRERERQRERDRENRVNRLVSRTAVNTKMVGCGCSSVMQGARDTAHFFSNLYLYFVLKSS
jgi:hypothetical protein